MKLTRKIIDYRLMPRKKKKAFKKAMKVKIEWTEEPLDIKYCLAKPTL